jgi:quercetin dioxygenase-like cupin family protein
MSETTRTLHFGPMDGKIYQLAKLALAFKRSEGEGEGSYSIYEQLEQPGTTVMRHRHPTYQETFIVLEGRFNFQVEDERKTMGPGEIIMIPRGAWHGFECISSEPGRLLTLSSPAGVFEAFIADVCSADLDKGPEGGAAFAKIAARHHIEFRI